MQTTERNEYKKFNTHAIFFSMINPRFELGSLRARASRATGGDLEVRPSLPLFSFFVRLFVVIGAKKFPSWELGTSPTQPLPSGQITEQRKIDQSDALPQSSWSSDEATIFDFANDKGFVVPCWPSCCLNAGATGPQKPILHPHIKQAATLPLPFSQALVVSGWTHTRQRVAEATHRARDPQCCCQD